jgi:hypothetical protein
VYVYDSTTINEPESGNQIIASVATASVPEATSTITLASALFLLPLGADLLRMMRKRQVA